MQVLCEVRGSTQRGEVVQPRNVILLYIMDELGVVVGLNEIRPETR